MNPAPMDDTHLAARAIAFPLAHSLVAPTLQAIANAHDHHLAARAQGFDLSMRASELVDGADVTAQTLLADETFFEVVAIASDQIKRLLHPELRAAFDNGMTADDSFGTQRRSAEDKSNG